MKKHLRLTALFFLIATLAATVITACQPSETKYKVSFIANDTIVSEVQSAGNEEIALPTAPEVDGFTFKGWYLDADIWQQPFDGKNYADKPITGAVNVYAKYERTQSPTPSEPQKYSVRFYANDIVISEVQSAGNEEIALPTAPEVDGFTFKGWYLDADIWQQPFDGKNYADKPITGAVNVYAKYERTQSPTPSEPQKYSVRFYANDIVISEVQSAGNEEIALPTAPEVDGFTFKGWYLDADIWQQPFDGKNYADKPITGAVSVYAKYERTQTPTPSEPQKYSVRFYANDIVVSEVQSAGNEEIALPTAPEVDGFTFKGWYLDADIWQQPFDGKNYADRPITGAVNVYAKYERTQPTAYLVEFDTDGGTAVNAVTVSVIETSPYTERSGYTFAGWFRDASHTQEVEFPFYPDANMTLYALWKYDGLKFSINSQAMIDGVTGIPEDGLLEIPDTVNGVKVKGISAYAFRYNTQIREVKIADAIPFYGVGCFWGCTSLVKVTLPDTVRSIPSDMFYGCSSLREMNFPSALQVIEYDAFWGTAFTAIVLPDSVTDIWNYAFKNCANLSSIDLGGVVSLGDGVFAGCSQLTSIAFPDTIRDLSGNFMFDGCTQLTQITFPAVPVALEYSFLDGTGYYNDASNWQDGVLYLNRHLITIGRDFTEKTEYTVKDGTICIANHAFNGAGIAPKVKKITLPDSMLAIGEGAFSRCNLLAQTNIPSGVRFVGKDAYEGTALYQSGKTNYLDNWLLSYVPQGNETTLVIRDGTIGIAEGKLLSSGASSVTEILLPETLKVIGESNFESMTVLTSVHLPKGLERIGKNAFRYCYALSDFDLSVCTSLKTIGDYAFSFCKAMTRFYIPASVEELGEGVFNQIPNVSVDFEIEQSQIPAGWSKNWDFTYADVPVIAHWGAKNSASEETV